MGWGDWGQVPVTGYEDARPLLPPGGGVLEDGGLTFKTRQDRELRFVGRLAVKLVADGFVHRLPGEIDAAAGKGFGRQTTMRFQGRQVALVDPEVVGARMRSLILSRIDYHS